MVNLSLLPPFLQETAARLSRDILFDKMVTKGGNGWVLIGRNNILCKDVVVKFYYCGGEDHVEPASLAQFDCDQILKVLHAERVGDEDAFFMTPYCDLGDLDDALEIKKFGPLESLDILLQVAAGVGYLHGAGFLHRDLKPSNIFCLRDGRFVIGDFGSIAPQGSDGAAKTLTRHSLIYRPPEEISSRIMYKESDVYQLGIVLYQLLGGYLPYNEFDWLADADKKRYLALEDPARQFLATDIIERKISKGRLVNFATLPAWVPSALKTVVRKCCAIDRSKRYETSTDLSAKLNNIRPLIPNWRIEEYPELLRKGKSFRIVNTHGGLRIEKRVGADWRTERRHQPMTMAQAVEIAERL